MFGVDTTTHYQLGYDFSSLEARIEAHFCYPFERDIAKSYCNSLLLEKPHDVHTMMAKKISEIIGREFTRSPAKSVKYACVGLDTDFLTLEKGYVKFNDLEIGDKLSTYSIRDGYNQPDIVMAKHLLHNKDLYAYYTEDGSVYFECTEDHRWMFQTENGFVLKELNKAKKSEYLVLLANGYSIKVGKLKKKFLYNGDVCCITTGNSTFYMRQENPETGDKFTYTTGNCTYGAQAKKVAQTIGESESVGKIVVDAFWNVAEPLKLLKESLNKEWELTGKRFIVGIDGRKVPTRSPHAILNSKFQNGGVICAKRTMVLHDYYIKQAGLGIDFFKDDWKNSIYSQQLIAYHDEAQMEISKSLVKFKMFETEEQAQEFKDIELKENNRIWSDISHAPKGGYYVAYTVIGELMAKAVDRTWQEYGMNVPLTAGYIIGRNWAECH